MSLKYRKKLSNEILKNEYSEIDKMIKDQHANHVVQKIIDKGYSDNIMEAKSNFIKGDKEAILDITESLKKILENFKSNV